LSLKDLRSTSIRHPLTILSVYKNPPHPFFYKKVRGAYLQERERLSDVREEDKGWIGGVTNTHIVFPSFATRISQEWAE